MHTAMQIRNRDYKCKRVTFLIQASLDSIHAMVAIRGGRKGCEFFNVCKVFRCLNVRRQTGQDLLWHCKDDSHLSHKEIWSNEDISWPCIYNIEQISPCISPCMCWPFKDTNAVSNLPAISCPCLPFWHGRAWTLSCGSELPGYPLRSTL